MPFINNLLWTGKQCQAKSMCNTSLHLPAMTQEGKIEIILAQTSEKVLYKVHTKQHLGRMKCYHWKHENYFSFCLQQGKSLDAKDPTVLWLWAVVEIKFSIHLCLYVQCGLQGHSQVNSNQAKCRFQWPKCWLHWLQFLSCEQPYLTKENKMGS